MPGARSRAVIAVGEKIIVSPGPQLAPPAVGSVGEDNRLASAYGHFLQLPIGKKSFLFPERRMDWEYDISRGTLTRVTFDGTAAAPVWSPDGKRIAYASFKNGQFVILWKPADGSGMEEVLVSPQSSLQVPLSFTPDGKFLAYMFSNPNARIQVNLAPLHGERTPKPFVASQFDDNGGLFSPDGRWLGYFSNESGQFEVYVQPFPDPGGGWQISASGGYGPVWARSGRELFYTDGNQIFSAGTTQLRLSCA